MKISKIIAIIGIVFLSGCGRPAPVDMAKIKQLYPKSEVIYLETDMGCSKYVFRTEGNDVYFVSFDDSGVMRTPILLFAAPENKQNRTNSN